jgi:predicted chitinase
LATGEKRSAKARQSISAPSRLRLRSVLIACAYWKRKGLNALADADDVKTITRRINGGLNGFDNRKALLERAKLVLGR